MMGWALVVVFCMYDDPAQFCMTLNLLFKGRDACETDLKEGPDLSWNTDPQPKIIYADCWQEKPVK